MGARTAWRSVIDVDGEAASPATGASGPRCVRVRIEGLVQGVGYRAWVERQAAQLALTGWVRNRRDGGVEASFRGPAGGVDEMIYRCQTGPRGATVAMVKVLDETEPGGAGFEVRPTV